MTPNKIKLHNLDQEVLNYFFKKENKIVYDNLSDDIITDIKNDTSGLGYNDTELRNRIINLENNKLDKSEAENKYYSKNNTYSNTEIDELIANNKEELLEKINGKMDIDEANNTFIFNQPGIITEDLLSGDLVLKVNARYENQRQTGNSGSSGSGITESDFNMLKTQVNVNVTDIQNLQNYINTSVLLATDKIGFDNLNETINEILNNSRSTEVPIEYSDLSNELQERLDSIGDSEVGNIEELKNEVTVLKEHFNLAPGELIFGKEPLGQTRKGHIFESGVLIINKSSDLEGAKTEAELTGKTSIIDLEANKIYSTSNIATLDFNEITDVSGTEYLVGKFALEYQTNNLYFGFNKDSASIIIYFDNLVKKIELQASLAEINNNINALVTRIDDIESRLTALEQGL